MTMLFLFIAALFAFAADPHLVMKEMDAMASRPLWPGFDPGKYPVAIYTGSETLLFRHPDPPDGFVEGDDAWRFEGRYPAVVANSSTEINGINTATLFMNGSTEALAAVAIHELFHVFQGERYPGWGANDAVLFTYPVDDEIGYTLRLMELEALARALDGDEAWTAKALALRKERAAALSDEHRAYERATELMEGTAHYVEYRALGKAADSGALRAGYGPAQIRHRCYATGRAMAALLDRFDEKWKGEIEALPFDEMLAARIDAAPAAFTEEEIRAFRKKARTAVEALRCEKKSLREKVLSCDGWKVRVEVGKGAHLLALKGIDPMNVMSLGGREVLHLRLFRLGSRAGFIEMIDPNFGRKDAAHLNALSFGVGPHPVFNGIRSVVYSGFPGEPEVEEDGEELTIRADGFKLDLRGAKVTRKGKEIHVLIKGA
jgi:hypothetical protein